jgi:hypothetical protein
VAERVGMERKDHLIFAVTAAVMTYIRSQEEQQLVSFAEPVRVTPPTISISSWAASGRQVGMDMRRLLQSGLLRR